MMVRVAVWLLLLFAGLGLLAALAWMQSPLLTEPLRFGLTQIGVTLSGQQLLLIGLTLLAQPLIALPAFALIAGIFGLGGERVELVAGEVVVMRLKPGARWGGAMLGVALAALVFWGFMAAPTLLTQAVAALCATAFLWMGWSMWSMTIAFDAEQVMDRDMLGRWRSFAWADLQRIVPSAGSLETQLIFRGGRRLRVSVFYAGLGLLMDRAFAELRSR
ncbi:hypothetical protein [Pontivivens ytuae]|uniref:Uncharacterized protein n=1 Tax=Pontivivens ytuae TaxID=2789856 RepID=A0A7S9LUV8_9RHOB|nr:hypothetical protein [Pontivivens ytuae]QPH55420.1 hypothetical protein I0K15_06710 [Pontivivens ytuae]